MAFRVVFVLLTLCMPGVASVEIQDKSMVCQSGDENCATDGDAEMFDAQAEDQKVELLQAGLRAAAVSRHNNTDPSCADVGEPCLSDGNCCGYLQCWQSLGDICHDR